MSTCFKRSQKQLSPTGLVLLYYFLQVVCSCRDAKAEVVTLYKGQNWDAAVEQNKFYGVIGRTDIMTASGLKTRELAFFLNISDHRFGILLEKENLRGSLGNVVPIVINFRSSQPSKSIQPLRLSARIGSGQARAMLTDADVAIWTHGFTAGTAMTVSFPTQDTEQWTYDLTGSTPAVTAMAGAIGGAGINDLPPPWRIDGYGSTQAPQSADQAKPSSSTGGDVEMQKRQLAIARAEAEKAKADAERARAEATKAQAEADRAQAQAQIEADARARAAEETKATAMRLAEEQRRKAAQLKAEQDARGTEP